MHKNYSCSNMFDACVRIPRDDGELVHISALRNVYLGVGPFSMGYLEETKGTALRVAGFGTNTKGSIIT